MSTIEPVSYLLDCLYYPTWYQDNFETSIDEITKELLESKFADRNASHMKYRGNSLKRDKSFFVDSLTNVPVYVYPGYQYKSIVEEYQLIAENKIISDLHQKLESEFKTPLNHVIQTKYQDGKDMIGFHDDKPKSINPKVPIYILSFGAERPLAFRKKDSKEISCEISLKAGSLFILGHETNKAYQHCIPSTSEVIGPRVSLIYRNIINKLKYETILKRANK
jgi:alkylated DNA repair dioxygenase AlkB